MTVEELKVILEELPNDANILINDGDGNCCKIQSAVFKKIYTEKKLEEYVEFVSDGCYL